MLIIIRYQHELLFVTAQTCTSHHGKKTVTAFIAILQALLGMFLLIVVLLFLVNIQQTGGGGINDFY